MTPANRAVSVRPGEPVPAGAGAGRSSRLVRQWPSLLAGVVLALVVISSLAAPAVAPFDPRKQNIMIRLSPPLTREGARVHALGTDQLGRDVLSRVIYGGRVSLTVSVSAVAGSGLLGVALGLWAGYARGPVEAVVMRLVELQLAFPVILLALVVVGLLGATTANIILVFIITSWPVYARTVRTTVLTVRDQEYVEAARAVGNRDTRILVRHILPNTFNPLIIIASFEVARLIILEASLGFLGLGIQPPTPTWGNMLAEGRDYLGQGWWIATFAGAAIILTVGPVNFLGDTLRDLLDPRLRAE
ncbi:MAG: ABC transporter permease [Armatimonadetes bacterium]|nr:ABC transporter permease [Armatimonadota bacterium]